MSPWDALPSDPATWAGHARALAPEARATLGGTIATEWAEGRLEPRLVAPRPRAAVTVLRRQLADALDAFGFGMAREVRGPRGRRPRVGHDRSKYR